MGLGLAFLSVVASTSSMSIYLNLCHMEVSWNGGTPKSSMFIGFSWIFDYKTTILIHFGIPIGSPHSWKPPSVFAKHAKASPSAQPQHLARHSPCPRGAPPSQPFLAIPSDSQPHLHITRFQNVHLSIKTYHSSLVVSCSLWKQKQPSTVQEETGR